MDDEEIKITLILESRGVKQTVVFPKTRLFEIVSTRPEFFGMRNISQNLEVISEVDMDINFTVYKENFSDTLYTIKEEPI